MATLAEQMYDDVLDVFLNEDEHAVPVTVTAPGESAVNTVGIFDPIEDADMRPEQDGLSVPRSAMVKLAEEAIDRPRGGWLIEVDKTGHPMDGVQYRVERSQPDGHGMYDVYVVKHENWEKSSQGHRIHRGA